MNNKSNAIYAILADSVYWDTRKNNKETKPDGSQSNWTPVPIGWNVIHEVSKSGKGLSVGGVFKNNIPSDGFTARAYKNAI